MKRLVVHEGRLQVFLALHVVWVKQEANGAVIWGGIRRLNE
jgi:ribosomal protein L35AE/L33A